MVFVRDFIEIVKQKVNGLKWYIWLGIGLLAGAFILGLIMGGGCPPVG